MQIYCQRHVYELLGATVKSLQCSNTHARLQLSVEGDRRRRVCLQFEALAPGHTSY